MVSKQVLQIRGKPLIPGGGPFVFGVLNVTPDSFSDGGRYVSASEAVEAGVRMAEEGADVIDVGGESTRPGSQPVPADEQIRRTRPVIAELARQFGSDGPFISIDTRLADVARAALEAGANIINDITALRDDQALAPLAASSGAGVILMHMQGTPATMQQCPTYRNVVAEVQEFLAERIVAANRAGIPLERLVVDPGIGFGKTTTHNLKILLHASKFRDLGVPVLIGPSRKRFIGEVLGIPEPIKRLYGTLAAVAACVLAGVECVRVHDVAACRQVVDLCAAIRSAG
ncbi:MAG: dihydropteroate synthase [Phycisphaerae bacterium]